MGACAGLSGPQRTNRQSYNNNNNKKQLQSLSSNFKDIKKQQFYIQPISNIQSKNKNGDNFPNSNIMTNSQNNYINNRQTLPGFRYTSSFVQSQNNNIKNQQFILNTNMRTSVSPNILVKQLNNNNINNTSFNKGGKDSRTILTKINQQKQNQSQQHQNHHNNSRTIFKKYQSIREVDLRNSQATYYENNYNRSSPLKDNSIKFLGKYYQNQNYNHNQNYNQLQNNYKSSNNRYKGDGSQLQRIQHLLQQSSKDYYQKNDQNHFQNKLNNNIQNNPQFGNIQSKNNQNINGIIITNRHSNVPQSYSRMMYQSRTNTIKNNSNQNSYQSSPYSQVSPYNHHFKYTNNQDQFELKGSQLSDFQFSRNNGLVLKKKGNLQIIQQLINQEVKTPQYVKGMRQSYGQDIPDFRFDYTGKLTQLQYTPVYTYLKDLQKWQRSQQEEYYQQGECQSQNNFADISSKIELQKSVKA